MGKSAQVIDGKGVGRAPLRKRVRNGMKTKGMQDSGRLRVGVEGRRMGRRAKLLNDPPPIFFASAHSKGVASGIFGTADSKRFTDEGVPPLHDFGTM